MGGMSTRATKREAAEHELVPFPLLSWETVVRSLKPGAPVTPSRYQTLKKNALSSAGVTVTRRRGRRAVGRQTVHSVLVVLSSQARRSGELQAAGQLLLAASDLEGRYAASLRNFLAHRSVQDLPEADFYEALVEETRVALERTASWKSVVYASGSVAELSSTTAVLRALTNGGEDVDVTLPRTLLDGWDLKTGDSLFVFQHLLGLSAVVEVLPAAPQTSATTFEREQADLEAVRSRGLTADDKRALDSLEAQGGLPRRTLRPAG